MEEIPQIFMDTGGGEFKSFALDGPVTITPTSEACWSDDKQYFSVHHPLRVTGSFKLSEGLVNAIKGVGIAFKSAAKAIGSLGKLNLTINADTFKFRQAIHKAKQKILFKKTLQKLPIKLRCKLRNSMWRNK